MNRFSEESQLTLREIHHRVREDHRGRGAEKEKLRVPVQRLRFVLRDQYEVCPVTHVTRDSETEEHVVRHMAHVTCVTCMLRAMKVASGPREATSIACESVTRHTSHATRHTSNTACKTLHVTRHASPVFSSSSYPGSNSRSPWRFP